MRETRNVGGRGAEGDEGEVEGRRWGQAPHRDLLVGVPLLEGLVFFFFSFSFLFCLPISLWFVLQGDEGEGNRVAPRSHACAGLRRLGGGQTFGVRIWIKRVE